MNKGEVPQDWFVKMVAIGWGMYIAVSLTLAVKGKDFKNYKYFMGAVYLNGSSFVRFSWVQDAAASPRPHTHSDIEKGFIRAECIDWKLLLECGSYTKAKELGKVRSEGKEYVMKDSDVVLFRFNV